MRVVSWIVRAILFLAALGFALSNTAVTELRFFGVDLVWRAPLVIFLLAFFGAGAALGLLAVVPTLYRQRREIGRLRREVRATARPAPAGGAAVQPPSPDVPVVTVGSTARSDLQ
ncbi:MAG: lipopolysaccharide assembly protein LapA domain-containing protein [Gammaproteobacteria bacterium]|jgi:uncharacterized integral membrane protein